MAFDMAKEHLRKAGLEDRIYEFEVSSATVELAAQAVGCEPARIAKTLSFMVDQWRQGTPRWTTINIRSSFIQRPGCCLWTR